LLATVGINGKVSFLEKGGTSEFTNSTGAYELDLSLVDDFNLAWREMHVQTDVFCSGAIVLPDKAARILNVGGWSLTSTFGIRLYAPNGSPGVNGTNDWEEDPTNLQLQVRLPHPSLHRAHQSSKDLSHRVAVGIPPHSFWQMAASSSWAVKQGRMPRPIRHLRSSLAFPAVARRSSLISSTGRTQTISIPSFMSSQVVSSLPVGLKRSDLLLTQALLTDKDRILQ
jgi:hypothetical protein